MGRQLSSNKTVGRKRTELNQELTEVQNEYYNNQMLYEINNLQLNRIIDRINTLYTELSQREPRTLLSPNQHRLNKKREEKLQKKRKKVGTSLPQTQTIPPINETEPLPQQIEGTEQDS